MDASTLCALVLKARKVFAKEQTFLSFPISPLPYTPRQLDFFDQSSAAALLESIHHRKEFSTLVDLIPTGEAWQPAGDAFLSEAYDAVLDSAQLAESARSADEEAQYQAARAVLRTGDHDSDKLVAYRTCRDAYLLAEQRYTAANLTAASASADDQQQWEQATRPAMRRELAELMQAWMFEGFKEEVDLAQAQVATLGARSPATTWADWRARYNPDVDALSDALDGSTVMPSGYSPSNALSEGAWRGFTLSPPEVSALLQEAPPAWLAAMLGATPPQAPQAISFEFSSAAIVRPWFDPALFKSRFWRFGEQDRLLSDGKAPPTGECPAYVAAVVFARRVQVTGAAATPAPALFNGFRFLATANLLQASVVKPRLHRVGLAAFAVKPRIAPDAVAATVNKRALNQFAKLKVDRAVVNRSFVGTLVFNPSGTVAATPTPAPAPLPTPAPAPAADPNTIFVLAFICKPLPQCPNPDPGLQW